MVEEIVESSKAGASLEGVICEKPLARNLAEARPRGQAGRGRRPAAHAYFENQLHMKSMQVHAQQLAPIIEAMGPPLLARSSEEHAGPHNPWFWDPTRQGGGVMSDMGCHCLAVGWYALDPARQGPAVSGAGERDRPTCRC